MSSSFLNTPLIPGCAPLGLGSLGLTAPSQAVELVLRNFNEFPFWPQLPKRTRSELLIHQVASSAPFLTQSGDPEYIFDREEACAFEFDYRNQNVEKCALDPEHALGWFAMMDQMSRLSHCYSYFKSQFPGPFTIASIVRDEERNLIGYEPEVLQSICRFLELHAKWQIERIKEQNLTPVLFMDEIVISEDYFDTLPLHPTMIEELYSGLVHSLKAEGAVVGIHCCADANWSLIIDTDLDIISFDAVKHLDGFLKYSDSIKDFLLNGGCVSWGVVPNTLPFASEKNIADYLINAALSLEDDNLTLTQILQQSLISATCGLGMLKPDETEQNCQITANVARKIRKSYLDI